MARLDEQLDIKYGEITFPYAYIDKDSYKVGIEKVASSSSGRSEVTGYMILDIVTVKDTVDLSLVGIPDNILPEILTYLKETHEAETTFPSPSTGKTETKKMYVGNSLPCTPNGVMDDGTIIWTVAISLVEM
jgi:hypothetical protein